MQTKIDLFPKGDDIVYIRQVSVDELPEDLQAQAEGFETLYSVHRSDGVPMALVANRRLAVALAKENDLTPLSVH